MLSRLIYSGKLSMFQKRHLNKIISSINGSNYNSLTKRYFRKDRKCKLCMLWQKGSWSILFTDARQPQTEKVFD